MEINFLSIIYFQNKYKKNPRITITKTANDELWRMGKFRFLLKTLVFYAVSGLILERNVLLNREEIPPLPLKKRKEKEMN